MTKTDNKIAEALIPLYIEFSKEAILHVEGNSMGATLAPSSKVLVKPIKRLPRIGEIILFRQKDKLVVHRIINCVRKHDVRLMTKGDGRFDADELVNIEDVIGLVVGIQRNGRIWVPWHWKLPFSVIVAIWSRLEAVKYPRLRYVFRTTRIIIRRLRSFKFR